MARRTRFTVRPLVRLLVVAVILGTGLGVAVPSHAVDSDGVKVVGKLDRMAADAVAIFGNRINVASNFVYATWAGTLVGVHEKRQIWQVFPTVDDRAVIAVRDMETLKITATIELPFLPIRGAKDTQGGDWLHAIGGGRIFFLNFDRTTVMEVDLRTHAQRQLPLGPPFVQAGRPSNAFAPGAMEYDPFSDSLLMLFGGVPNFNAANAVTWLYRIDLKQGASPTGAGVARQIRSCNGPLAPIDTGFTSQIHGIITRDNVYFACQRAGAIGAVVRLERSSMFNSESVEEIVAGPAYLETSFADPASGRLFLVTIAGEIWAFDTNTMAFVGVIAAGAESTTDPHVGYGIDPATGRLFFLSSNYGLGIAEGRFYPIPQARVFTDLIAPGQERIISDARTNRFFVLEGLADKRVSSYTIYQTTPAPAPPPPPDPDRSTIDAPEQEGVTEGRFFGSATGYGVRVLAAKGFAAVPPAPAAGQVAPTASIIATNLNSKCGFTDRELVAGRVSKAEYETGSTAAQAIGVDVDERTKLDLQSMSRCDLTARNGSTEYFSGVFATGPTQVKEQTNKFQEGPGWDNEAATCSSSEGGEPKEGTSKHETPSEGTVKCPVPGGTLEASATGYLNGSLTVGRATTTSVIKRDATGVIADVVAEAHDINIAGAGVLYIGEVTSVATSRSNGRPGRRPMSDHKVTVKGVRHQGTSLCEAVCDLQALTTTLNLLMGGRVEFRTENGLDGDLRQGTPKGALTAVQKSAARQASDQALVGDPTTEVAGLEMVVYNDNKPFGRARQIYQFAGVSTAATYNIQRIPSGAGFGDDVPGDGFDESELSAAGADGAAFAADGGGLSTLPTATIGAEEGGPIARFLRALGRGIRMFLTKPRHAILLLTAWALFSLPPVLSRRRRLLAAARST